jgi:uncharacterized domain HDIG
MSEKVKNQKKINFSLEQGFFDRSRYIQIAIGLLFALALFFFLHFREVKVDTLEPDTVAEKYVVAQTDFTFLDQEATNMIRQDAVREVGNISRLVEKDIRNEKIELENFLSQSLDWHDLLPDVSLTEMFLGIDLFQREMQQIRFTDPRTLQIIKREGIESKDVVVYVPPVQDEKVSIPLSVWNHVKEIVFKGSRLPTGIGSFLAEYYSNRMWNLDEDLSTVRLLRKQVQNEVSDKYTRIEAGDRIIDRGEKVVPRHLSMLQAMKKALSDDRNLLHPLTILGSFVLAAFFTFMLAIYLYYSYPKILHSNKQLLLLATILVLTLILARGGELWIVNSKSSIAELIHYPLFVPFGAILICHLLNPHLAIFVSGFLTIIFLLTDTLTPTGSLMNLASSLVAILETRTLRRRKEIFLVCAKAWLATAWVILGIHLYFRSFGEMAMIIDLLTTLGFMVFTAVLVIGLLPLFEAMFQILTDVTLMEYLDPSHPLLKRLSIEAPGTYQHSIVVGILAEAAALSIGSNGLFCRVSTMYHDVGKIATPQYFTENQQGEINIHQLLTPQESAQVIMAHVSEGVGLARKAGLPEQFIDVIKEHHGTSLVYYFYRQYLDQMGGDKARVDERPFRYCGPKPRSKECAIVMLADCFEAASRSVDEMSESALITLMDKLIQLKTQDGQLDESDLTFQELAIVRKAMIQTLLAAGHGRIKYPKVEEEPKLSIYFKT